MNKPDDQKTKLLKFENWIMPFIVVLLLTCSVCGVISVGKVFTLEQEIESIKNEKDLISYDDTQIVYYRELSNKTDSAINSILTIVGIVATFVAFFSFLLAYRAPKELEEQIKDVKNLANGLEEQIKEAKNLGKEAGIAADKIRSNLEVIMVNELNLHRNSFISRLNAKADKLSRIIQSQKDEPIGYAIMMQAEIFMRLGERLKLYGNNNYKHYFIDAIRAYSDAIKFGADAGDCKYNIGSIYDKLDDAEGALKYYNEAIDINPKEKTYFIARGFCYIRLEEYDKSFSDFDEVIKSDMDEMSVLAYYGKSVICRKKCNTEEEHKWLNKAARIDPHCSEVKNRISELRIEEWRNNKKFQENIPYIYIDEIKIRNFDSIVSHKILIALGFDSNERMTVLDFRVINGGSEEIYTDLFTCLTQQGLCGVKMVVSDDYNELKNAINKFFRTASWRDRNEVDFRMADLLRQMIKTEDEENRKKYAEKATMNIRKFLISNYKEQFINELHRRISIEQINPDKKTLERLVGDLLIK